MISCLLVVHGSIFIDGLTEKAENSCRGGTSYHCLYGYIAFWLRLLRGNILHAYEHTSRENATQVSAHNTA